jgi:hypothetical protein
MAGLRLQAFVSWRTRAGAWAAHGVLPQQFDRIGVFCCCNF